MTFMRQDPDWTLPDNSLNMELYFKGHLPLIENGNIRFSKLIIETLQDILSPQLSQSLSSSSYLSQSSLIRSPPPSSVPRSNLLSIQTLSQSSFSQSLSATAIPFIPKRQKFLLNSPTAPPKSQTLTAPPPFHQDFSPSLKTTSDHIPSAKPTKLTTSPTSASSSTGTPQSSQIKFQPPSSIPLPLLSTVTSPYTPTFPSSPTPTAYPSFSVPLHLAIISYLILHQKYYLQLQILFYMLRNTLLKKCKYHFLSYLTWHVG